MELTFLGTGTSVGVPMIGCHCRVCTSKDPRNRRRRTSLHVKTDQTTFVIDTPDFRQQVLDFEIERVDAVVFTHAHADHIFGFDDIRRFNTIQQSVIPAYAERETLIDIQRVFSYIGTQPSPLGLYRPLIEFREVTGLFEIGDVTLTPLHVVHGNKMTGYLLEHEGMRIGYVPDCLTMPAETIKALQKVDVMILDALRYRPHPTHLCVRESLTLLEQIGAKQAYLIHLCHDIDHAELEANLPEGVAVSYDGMRVRVGAGVVNLKADYLKMGKVI